jgi:transcriptional regulator with XRE-family HTH domain
MPAADPLALGLELTRLRLARGLTRARVVDRIPTYYADAGTYGRVERGERHPDRQVVIAILVQGLLLRDHRELDRVLQLAGFEGLTAEELEDLQLEPSESQPVGGAKVGLRRSISNVRPYGLTSWTSAVVLTGSTALTALTATLAQGHSLYVLLTSCLYGALYVISLYLERAFDPESGWMNGIAPRLYGLIAVTSSGALATDRLLVDSHNLLALWISLMIFALAALIQFLIARPGLSENAVVQATFQTQTAQSAHLKNTSYFLLIVVLFWLPPYHCVATLSREIQAGHADWVRQEVERDLMLGRGLIALSVRWLLFLLAVIFLISLYMAHHLLDELKPHPRLNSYTILFYLRAFLYFLLCLICIGWYAYSLNELG